MANQVYPILKRWKVDVIYASFLHIYISLFLFYLLPKITYCGAEVESVTIKLSKGDTIIAQKHNKRNVNVSFFDDLNDETPHTEWPITSGVIKINYNHGMLYIEHQGNDEEFFMENAYPLDKVEEVEVSSKL